MRLFNSIRLAYFEDFENDPLVESVLASRRPIRITSPYQLKELVNKCRGYNFFFSGDPSADIELQHPPLSANGTLERCTIIAEKYATVVCTAGTLDLGDIYINAGTLWVAINTTDPEFKIFYMWIDPRTEVRKSCFKPSRLAYFEDATEDIDLIKLTGFQNYTPEICDKIKSLCEAGLTDSYPRLEGNYVIWRRAADHDGTGNRHRSGNLPAFESAARTAYYVNGNLHRDDGGPAKIVKLGGGTCKEWFFKGKKTRIDGPAEEIVVDEDIRLAWWKDGEHMFDNDPQYPGSYKEEIIRDFPQANADYWAGKILTNGKIVPLDWKPQREG